MTLQPEVWRHRDNSRNGRSSDPTITLPYPERSPASHRIDHSPRLVIDPIPKPRGIHHRQTDPHPVLLQLDIVRLDLDRHLVVCVRSCLAQESRVERRGRVRRVREE